MKTLINDVITTINAIPELNWVDDNLGQLKQTDPPLEYPCALVGIEDINQTNYEGNSQYGDLALTITLICLPPENSPSNPEKIHSFAETIYDLIQKIDQAIHQLEGDTYSPLSRIKINADLNYYPARYILTYSTILYE